MKIRISLFQNNIVVGKDLFSKGDTEGHTFFVPLWLQLPKYSNKSSKLPGQTTQLGMCLEILNLPSLINFLSWIWVAIMSQLTPLNANEMQKRLVMVVWQCFGSCSSVGNLTRITHWAHNWLFISCKRDWLALSDEALPVPIYAPPHPTTKKVGKTNLTLLSRKSLGFQLLLLKLNLEPDSEE